ncbi:GNAT family N-acetyltransferase [Belliella pelovolcani]|uniref:Acetyltransferase (GNAT) domain-containing protein n=1 Tax=Belliella pelovolcani TaxID=529505 RepID=A0A1N7JVZ0_9BACT|nr:GNAT family N-acetyltransferase [Belliella pelovolcani]SIS53525.1 Acetyltransferase (GNAT) domain-containing protein [Belliella pelovolcani]
MIIRKAEVGDIPKIVALLQLALGEGKIPKSTTLWRWKHLENPFGPSLVFVAEEHGELLGVRAFLQWSWVNEDKEFQALRAVDTAVHPNHQGKGIFSKLTAALAEEARIRRYHFIFNTPNEKSLPGYLKLGWKKLGKVGVGFEINSLIPKSESKGDLPTTEDWESCLKGLEFRCSKGFQTQISKTYLFWRYAINPILRYGFLTDYRTYFLIYRKRSMRFGVELRIVDLLHIDQSQKIDQQSLSMQIQSLQQKTNITTYSIRQASEYFKSFWVIKNDRIGPVLTFKQLNMTAAAESEFIDQWKYSLGDMELF